MITIPDDLWGFELGKLYCSAGRTRAFIGTGTYNIDKAGTTSIVILEENIPYVLHSITANDDRRWVRLFILYNNQPLGLHLRFTKNEMISYRDGGLRYYISRVSDDNGL